MLAHVPCFGRNPRGSPDFLAYPVPNTCMHVLGTRVMRRLGVARSASSPKAAQALGCSLTPGLRISFGRVTCMARAASVPGLWALGFLLLACVCVWSGLRLGVGFVAAAGGRSVVPTSPTAPTIEARCVPATCVRLAYTVSCVVTEGAKGREERGGQGRHEGKKATGGCSATCVPLAQGLGHQRAKR